MKLLTIQEVWDLEKAHALTVPSAVVSAAKRAIETFEEKGGARLGEVGRAKELASGRIGRAMVERLSRMFDTLEKGLSWELHGGDAGHEWIRSIVKAEPEETERPSQKYAEHREIRRRLSMLMSAHGDDGVPIESFRDHVERHGHKAVAQALRDLGAVHVKGRVVAKRPRAPATVSVKAKAQEAPVEKELHTEPLVVTAWRPIRFRGI